MIHIPRKGKKTIAVAIMKEYRKEIASDEEAVQVLDGVVEYFEKSLPVLLLYDLEREAFDQWDAANQARSKPKPYAEVFGLEHFVRLFVKLPSLLIHTRMDPSAVDALRSHVYHLLSWMEARLADEEYFMKTNDFALSS